MSEVRAFFEGVAATVDKGKVAGMTATYQFNITGDDPQVWSVAIANDDVVVSEGAAEKASIELTMSDADFLALLKGQLNGQMAFLTGKLKIKGDMALAMKLQSVFKLG
jgi:putative sterol carrier protein